MQLEQLDGVALGDVVRKGEISPVEVIDYFEDNIEKRNPSINAFTYTKFEEAREQAKEMESRLSIYRKRDEMPWLPFAGVPFGLKDFLDTKTGWPNSHGGVKHLVRDDQCDSEICKAAETLGGIAIGKTNAPSFGFRGTTDNKMYGVTHNPFNLDYNPGGSSGGSCAAVGSRMVPLAECGDAGGSGRIPAAWCNCIGFKPSAGLVPSICRPDAWAATHPYCCGGPATRSVRDAATILDEMQYFDLQDPLSVPLPAKNFKVRRDIKDLKIGYTFNFDLYPDCDSEIKDAIETILPMLKDAGAQCVEPITFNFNHSLEAMENAWLLGISIDDAITPEMVKAIEEHPENIPEEFIYWHEKAKIATMQDYRNFHEVRTDILDSHLRVFKDFDIILAPVTGCMPVKNANDNNTKGPKILNGVQVNELIGFGYTYLENMIGTPAASIPIALGSNNLPIGIQVIAKRYFDEDIFTVAYTLEEINPWEQNYSKLKC